METQFAWPKVSATVNGMLAEGEAKKLKVLIDRRFPLELAVEAYEHVERGKPLGRVVLEL